MSLLWIITGDEAETQKLYSCSLLCFFLVERDVIQFLYCQFPAIVKVLYDMS